MCSCWRGAPGNPASCSRGRMCAALKLSRHHKSLPKIWRHHLLIIVAKKWLEARAASCSSRAPFCCRHPLLQASRSAAWACKPEKKRPSARAASSAPGTPIFLPRAHPADPQDRLESHPATATSIGDQSTEPRALGKAEKASGEHTFPTRVRQAASAARRLPAERDSPFGGLPVLGVAIEGSFPIIFLFWTEKSYFWPVCQRDARFGAPSSSGSPVWGAARFSGSRSIFVNPAGFPAGCRTLPLGAVSGKERKGYKAPFQPQRA